MQHNITQPATIYTNQLPLLRKLEKEKERKTFLFKGFPADIEWKVVQRHINMEEGQLSKSSSNVVRESIL